MRQARTPIGWRLGSMLWPMRQRRGDETLERLLTDLATASERAEATSSQADLAADSSGALPAKKEAQEAQEAQEALAHRAAVGRSKRHESATGTSHSRYSSRLALKDGASRHRAALQVRHLRPCRGIALRHLLAAARALCASVLRPLRSSLALARSALRRMWRSTTRVRLGARSPRVRGRRACVRRILEGARTPGSLDCRRRTRRRRRPEAGRRRDHLRPRRSRSPAASAATHRPPRSRRELARPGRSLSPRSCGAARGSIASATSRAPSGVQCRGAFSPRCPLAAQVCLIDDVYTTGSTATACATELRRAGARTVEVVCFARPSDSAVRARKSRVVE